MILQHLRRFSLSFTLLILADDGTHAHLPLPTFLFPNARISIQPAHIFSPIITRANHQRFQHFLLLIPSSFSDARELRERAGNPMELYGGVVGAVGSWWGLVGGAELNGRAKEGRYGE